MKDGAMLKTTLRISLILAIFAFSGQAIAQEATKSNDNKTEAPAPDMTSYNQAVEKAQLAIKELATPLKGENQKHFYVLYTNYNIISAVKSVRRDVGNAIKACGEANPSLKIDMDTRHDTWKTEIGKVLDEAESNLGNMIKAQDYAPAEKIKGIFGLLDEARTEMDKQIDKVPVTTPEACTYLKDKMGETQENLTRLLRETLVSVGKAFPPDAPPSSKDSAANSKPEKQ